MASKQCEDYLSDDSSDWSSAEELDNSVNELNPICCLFCCETLSSLETTFAHIITNHNLNLIEICKKHKFNAFQYIKLLNFIRREKPDSNQLTELIESKVWDFDQYMKPTIIDDPLLMFDIESECCDSDNDYNTKTTEAEDYSHLSREGLVEKLRRSEVHIKQLQMQLKSINELMNKCLTDDQPLNDGLNVVNLSKSEDSHYVSSYSHYSIHYEMLSDKTRTNAYKDAILENESYFRGKTVLDIGCGTGILSLFAAKSGAQLVVAVDQSDVIYKAMDIVRENGLMDKIKFIKSKIESINFVEHNLPQKFDIIISEWMGYFLLFEGMLDTILYGRNDLLKESGILMPNQCSITIAGISDQTLHKRYITFWDNVYGWKMSCMKNDVIKEANIESIPKEYITTTFATIKHFDLMQCSIEETQKFHSKFQFICNSDEPIVAIVGWFDTYFNSEQLDHKVILSTSPFSEDTHWKQTVFLLKNPLITKKGHKIEGTIDVYRNKKDIRSLIIEINMENEKQAFYLS